MMTKVKYVNLICIVLICVQHYGGFVEGRYLPTRGNTDNLDRLRELLRDILESDVQKSSVEAPPEGAQSRYDGLNGLNDDFNFAVPKHMQHKNSRLIFKRSTANNLLRKPKNF
ncbi:hypothetical protein Bhyg_17354 [Pseudolycoriella hygida]|uniref:Uncharacterized protein n=1 Tax=Pseudolycoriella hygida TaxID=35572 RepID=A0A9Q0MIU2_9DIPT|nr:hypothetical protein Bhyg_17354 [Pseudolycoriella hygida]